VPQFLPETKRDCWIALSEQQTLNDHCHVNVCQFNRMHFNSSRLPRYSLQKTWLVYKRLVSFRVDLSLAILRKSLATHGKNLTLWARINAVGFDRSCRTTKISPQQSRFRLWIIAFRKNSKVVSLKIYNFVLLKYAHTTSTFQKINNQPDWAVFLLNCVVKICCTRNLHTRG